VDENGWAQNLADPHLLRAASLTAANHFGSGAIKGVVTEE
jgi:hypothetical protein